jgi:hypothetical protein
MLFSKSNGRFIHHNPQSKAMATLFQATVAVIGCAEWDAGASAVGGDDEDGASATRAKRDPHLEPYHQLA